MKNRIFVFVISLLALFGLPLTITAAGSTVVTLLGDESTKISCDGSTLLLERQNKTKVFATCRPHQDTFSMYRYVRFVAETEISGQPWTSMAEFNVLDKNGQVIDRSNWSISADSQETNWSANNVIDGDAETIWHTQWKGSSPPPPHEIIIDMGAEYDVSGFRYLPRQNGTLNGTIKDYKFFVGNDGVTWSLAAEGAFPTNSDEKVVVFDTVEPIDEPTATPTPLPTATSIPSSTDPPIVVPTDLPVELAIINLVLVNADTNQDISTLTDGLTIDLNSLPTRNFSIRADTQPSTVGSVVFSLDNNPNVKVENFSPYSLGGHNNGNYLPWTASISQHILTVTPYSESNGNGEEGTAITVTFTVVDSSPTPSDTPASEPMDTYQYVRFVAETEINGQPWTSMAEFNVLDGSGQAIDRSGWTVSGDSQEPTTPATNIIDGNVDTIWHTQWKGGNPPPPHEVIINMGVAHEVSGFRYLPRQGSNMNGTVKDFTFFVSNDGLNWSSVKEGSFLVSKDEKLVTFDTLGPVDESTATPISSPPSTPTPTDTPTPLPTDPIIPNSEGKHPQLLFGAEEVERYRVEIAEGGNVRQELYGALEEYLTKKQSTNILSSAFYYQLTADQSHLELAKGPLFEMVANDCWDAREGNCYRAGAAGSKLAQVSLTYDLLYNGLTITEREQVKSRIATEVCRLYEAFTYGKNNTAESWNNWWYTDYTQNHFHSVTGGMMLGALAIKNDSPPTCTAVNQDGQQREVTNQEILSFGLQKMERNYLIFDRINDGSYPEGDSYVTAYSSVYLPALWAVRRNLTPRLDLIGEQRLKQFPLFYLYNSPPGQYWNRLTNYGDFYTSSRSNDLFPRDLQLSATINHNPLAAWLAQQYYYSRSGRVAVNSTNGNAAFGLVLNFIFVDPTLKPQAPADLNLDLSYHAHDWEGVLMRSNWSDTAVAAALKTGPPGGHVVYNLARSNHDQGQWVGGGQEPTEFDFNPGHMHADANGLYLYANNTFLLPEMVGYGDTNSPWGKHTSAHNTIMVSDDQGQMRGQIQGDSIGGSTFGYTKWFPGADQFWNIETPESEVGIIEHASTQSYDYSLGQATSAYWPELGLERFHRHVLFAREPGYLLVVDDLEATTSRSYDWMGHSTGNVTQEDTWLKVEADNDQRLGIAVLAPAEFSFSPPASQWQGHSLQGLYNFAYLSQNQSIYEWNIRQACQQCRFITVLFPTDEARWNQKPTVTNLADTNQLAAVQVEFDNGRTDTLAISLTPGQSLTAGNLSFNGRAAVVERQGSTLQRALLVRGSVLREGDTPLIEGLSPSSFLEMQLEGNQLIVRSPDPSGVTLYAPGVSTVLWQQVDEADNTVSTQLLSFTQNDRFISLSN